LYSKEVDASTLVINPIKPDFEGEYTLVTFSLSKALGKAPDVIGTDLGHYLVEHEPMIAAFQVVKGFLNLTLSDPYWSSVLADLESNSESWKGESKSERVVVEFASPNTNKPLHLGHIRNILLGWSMSQILEAAGYEVSKVQIINDRGIAICKSMLAWQIYGGGATPDSEKMKPDHFVGHWYVLFEKEFKEEYKAWQVSEAGQTTYDSVARGRDQATFFTEYKNTYFNEHSVLGRQAREMLYRWEAGDADTLALWKQMNDWVYTGFDATYERLGVSFDKLYYESNTWQLGKSMVADGLKKELFYQKEDGSVWVDLEDQGLDHKILLRSDGTSVYITQDLGTAHLRYEDMGVDRMIYVVADEQDYHFQVLFAALKKLGEPYADGLHHLSYGMVDLPSGKMKSREGTVVDADELMDTVFEEAHKATQDRGEIGTLTPDEQRQIIENISLGALKYFILRVDPKKRMLFDPTESVDLQGQTGPYIQNAYVRINSILNRGGADVYESGAYALHVDERRLLSELIAFGDVVEDAARQYNPSLVAQYCYSLSKAFHRFYHDHRVLNAETEAAKAFRLRLIPQIAHVLKQGMHLLGIGMPDKM
jgi:arginyl-tRNA synthetase